MAEIKNSFLKSKMNKDVDDRLVPNGEYRDALNVSVGNSEDSDTGTLRNIDGNAFVVGTDNPNLLCIGQIADNQNNRIFQFWTDYVDPEPGVITPAVTGDMRITVYDLEEGLPILKTLVSGVFLNFAYNTEFRINGVNIIEGLLFWTDNRNQPRKINIEKAINDPAYYTDEIQISVAKYAPVFPMSVYLNVNVSTIGSSSNPTTKSTSFVVSASDIALLKVGLQLISTDVSPPALLEDYAVITNLDTIGNVVTISYNTTVTNGSSLSFFGSTMSNEEEDGTWPGDPNFLKDKYVRFSYRYKFDDGEFSLIAPFTQIMFIPDQNGYFLNGNENDAFRSTVVNWMENNTNNVLLNIELPDKGNQIENSHKITSIDILYKESDALAIKVLETISVNEVKALSGDSNIYTYNYQSQKPYKTLPESQTVRVYDRVPIRARAQDSAGNRIIYGNFVDKSTPPISINYNLAVVRKTDIFNSWAEYPNHTLKQNRNYQAGIILADKFGRQSSVILSSNDVSVEAGDVVYGGSTVYSPYISSGNQLNVKTWRGNTLAMIVNSPIVSERNEGTGTPGLYATVSGEINGSSDGFEIDFSSIVNNVYTFKLASGASQVNKPKVGNFLRGQFKDYVKVLSITPSGVNWVVTTDGQVSDLLAYTGDTPDVKFSYSINPLGWYSYKIVVRQQQQEYYNVYLPGILNGYPKFQTNSSGNPSIFPTTENNKTAHIVLLNDNINKIPRDLAEVGPDQKQYRSSVELYGRVENLLDTGVTTNRQYYPLATPDVASTIASSNDLNFLVTQSTDNPGGTASTNFYQLNTSPVVARISTAKNIGVLATTLVTAGTYTPANSMVPYLSVYETKPVVSVLDLFWESTSAGLISDLNADVLSGSDIAIGFDNLSFNFNEFQDNNGVGTPLNAGDTTSPFITGYFKPINATGAPIPVDNIVLTVNSLSGTNRSADFTLVKETSGPFTGFYAIKINKKFVYLNDAATVESYIFTFNISDSVNGDTVLTKAGSLNNSAPVVTNPAFQAPTQIILLTEFSFGAVLSCTGKNGSLNPALESQGLHWSILNTSTANWATYFTINASTGIVSLTENALPIGEEFTLNIRVTDAYDFGINQPSSNSLTADRSIIFLIEESQSICGQWSSVVTPGPFVNNVFGAFNFWKLLQPGETINTVNTSINIDYYEVFNTSTAFVPSVAQRKLSFSGNGFYGDFNLSVDQGSEDTPAENIFISGILRTNTGREIAINTVDSADTFTPPYDSTKNSCQTYISAVNRGWKLTNSGSLASIKWKALLANGTTIIGGTLAPGAFVGSTSFGGTYGCIRQGSLSFGSGGVADDGVC